MKLPLACPHGFSRHLAILLITLTAATLAATSHAETSLRLTGEPGSGIASGTTYSYDAGTFNTTRNYQNGVSLSFNGTSAYWYLNFAGPNNTALAPGLYENATSFPFSEDAPGMRVYGTGGSCSEETGSFRVKQVTYGSGEVVESFWVVFEQRCNGYSGSLFGEYRYNADVSVVVSAPFSRSVPRLGTVAFPISATGIATGPIEIQALGLPVGAEFMWDENRGATFTWTPTASQYGRHRVTFVAEDGEGRIDSTTTDIRVTGVSSLTIDSDPGDYVGDGRHETYDSGTFAATANSNNGVTFTFRNGNYNDEWSISFAAPNGAPLAPGAYPNAMEFGNQSAGRPGIRALVASRYCSNLSGEFLIKQVSFAPGGGVESLWARFEQHCNAGPALTGEVRYNANVTVELLAPVSETVERGTLLAFSVTGTNVEPGPVLLTAAGLPDGASFDYDGDRGAAFSWTPTVDQTGTYFVTFRARNEQGDEDSVQTRIQVTGVTSLRIVTEPNEPLGNGSTYEYTSESTPFTATRTGSAVLVSVGNPNSSDRWGIALAPRTGGVLLPGFYANAQLAPSASRPGMSIFRYFNSCNSTAGNFQVKQYVVGPDSSVESFWATFEQHCNGSARALRGEIRYNADVRVVVSAPVARNVVREETLEFEVSATDLEAGPITLYATSLPAGATFTDNGDRTGTFRFTPTIAQTGSHVVVFHGRNAAGREDSTATNVVVTGLTSLAIESEPGDPIGSGGSYFYPATAGLFAPTFNTYDRSVSVSFQEGLYGDQWSMSFAPPTGSDLYGAIFEGIRRYPDATHPGFSVSRSVYPYGPCGELEGQFQVLQLVRGVDTQVLTLWATFDVRCVEAGGWIHGEIRYNADVRLVLNAPPRIEAQRGQPLAIGVQGTDLAERPVALSAFAEPEGATFVDQGDDTGVLIWTPGWDQYGEHVVGFLASDGAGGFATARTRIVVRGVTSLAMHSEPGDSVGRGLDYSFDEENAVFYSWRSSRNHSAVTVDGDTEVPWQLGFAASDTGRLEVGTYPNAAIVPTPYRPSLIVTPLIYYGGYPGELYPPCGSITGEFRVKHVEYNSEGRLRALWALFEQHCDDALPGLSGELRFNADIVVAITSPRRIAVDPDEQLQFVVHAENLAGGAASLTAQGLPTGATFVDHGNNTGTFTWTPGSNDLGLRELTFVATGPFGRADSSVTALRVRGTTRLSMQSEAGDPVGEGLQYELAWDAGTFQATRNAANGVSVRFRDDTPEHDFQFDFAAPGNAPLTTRTYGPAMRYPFQERTRAGMDARLDDRSCGTLIGNFTVHEITYGTGDELSSFHVSFVQRCNGAGPGLAGEILFNAGQPTFTYASFVSADLTPRLARITWRVEDAQNLVRIERQARDLPWIEVARTAPDGSGLVVYEDIDVSPGDRIGYRIGLEIDGMTRYFGLQWVDIPSTATLALGRAYPNPTTDAVSVSLALPDRSPARLELVDIAGRRLASVDAGALGPGQHQITLDHVRYLPPGVYTVRLIHGGRSLITPVCVVR